MIYILIVIVAGTSNFTWYKSEPACKAALHQHYKAQSKPGSMFCVPAKQG